MPKVLVVAAAFLLLSCSKQEKVGVGKWYTYSESGDYMELWIGEDQALSYLSGIDEFLLYRIGREGNRIVFDLLESRVIDEHAFELAILETEGEIMKTVFLSSTRTDSLKTYFRVDEATPTVAASLLLNRENMESLLSRMKGSHSGHNH